MPDPKIMRSSEAALPIQYCSELEDKDKYIKESEESEADNNEIEE